MAPRSPHFAALVERAPDNELFRFSLAQALAAEGRAEEAGPHYAFCVAKKADWMMPRILLGKLHLAAGRHAEARPLLVAALDGRATDELGILIEQTRIATWCAGAQSTAALGAEHLHPDA